MEGGADRTFDDTAGCGCWGIASPGKGVGLQDDASLGDLGFTKGGKKGKGAYVVPPRGGAKGMGGMCGIMGLGDGNDMGQLSAGDGTAVMKGMGGKGGIVGNAITDMGDTGAMGEFGSMPWKGNLKGVGDNGSKGDKGCGKGMSDWGTSGIQDLSGGILGTNATGILGDLPGLSTERLDDVAGLSGILGAASGISDMGILDGLGSTQVSGGSMGIGSLPMNIGVSGSEKPVAQPQKTKSNKNADRYSNMLDALMQGGMMGMMGMGDAGAAEAGAGSELACFGGLDGSLDGGLGGALGGCLGDPGLNAIALGTPLGLGALGTQTDALTAAGMGLGAIGGGSPGVTLGPEINENSETARFCDENGVDEGAKKILLNEAPEVQAAVLDRGSLHGCKNPSAALMGRLRDARQQARQGQLQPAKILGGTGFGAIDTSDQSITPEERIVMEAVDKFVSDNRIDVSAARTLRNESIDVQRAVISRGDTVGAVNPSAAVMCRIKDYKAGRGTVFAAQAQALGYAQALANLDRDRNEDDEPDHGYRGGGRRSPAARDDRRRSRSTSRRQQRRSRSGGRGGRSPPRRSRSPPGRGRGDGPPRRYRSRSFSRRRPRSPDRRRDGASWRY
eukprot:TRINITY_DN1485_c2_g1_i1.p1 TRINITY_DN1485_c2_g1~~TRINITY_DN1485_c2_g1_i1.p1  ORF type:complete len:618 (+),score=98.03 TRINITY_DN1485_c2_g1_i1:224-2077(+)